jgi:head-tail adaptor
MGATEVRGVKAGALRQRVEFLRPLTDQDELGQRVPGYSLLFESWASVEPLRGNELFNGGQYVNIVDTKIEIRYPSHHGLRATDVARVKGPTGGDYNLVAVLNPEHGGKALSMMAKRVDSEGLGVIVPPPTPLPKIATFTAGASITSPKTWEPTTEFAVECQVRLGAAQPATGWYSIVTWNPGAPSVSIAYNASTSALELRVIDAVSGIITAGTPVMMAMPAGIFDELIWFRMQVSNGNCAFFASPDRDESTWTFLGAVPFAFTSVSAGPRNIDVGGGGGYYGFPSWEGDIGRVVAWIDVAMTQQAFDFDPEQWVSGNQFTSGGDVYTMNGGVTIA